MVGTELLKILLFQIFWIFKIFMKIYKTHNKAHLLSFCWSFPHTQNTHSLKNCKNSIRLFRKSIFQWYHIHFCRRVILRVNDLPYVSHIPYMHSYFKNLFYAICLTLPHSRFWQNQKKLGFLNLYNWQYIVVSINSLHIQILNIFWKIFFIKYLFQNTFTLN